MGVAEVSLGWVWHEGGVSAISVSKRVGCVIG